MSFVDQVNASRGDNVYLVRGKDRGEPAWHYVRVDPLKRELFEKAVKSGTVDCSKFGEVLESGWGENPPDIIVKKMQDQFG